MQLLFEQKKEHEHTNYQHRKENDRNRTALTTSFGCEKKHSCLLLQMLKKSATMLVFLNLIFLAESSTHYTKKMSEMSSRFKQSTHKIPMNFQHLQQSQEESTVQPSTHNHFHHKNKFQNENIPIVSYNVEEEKLNKHHVTSSLKHSQQQQQNNLKNTIVFSDHEVINKKALIDAFKIKLLKLLDVEAAPSPLEVNITRTPIPEPVIREYNKLVKMSKAESNRKYFHSLNRGSRDMSLRSHENELEDESVRFNGSVVQQITLLPAKGYSLFF
jgi:hypothetical protein